MGIINLTVLNKSDVIEIEAVEKFNPYHDKLGRFTTASGATVFTWRTKDSSKQGLADKAISRAKDAHVASGDKQREERDKQMKHVRNLESRIKDLDHERLGVFFNDGEPMFEKDGNSYSVDVTREAFRMKGKIVTHNHPNSSIFSEDDIDLLKELNLQELRATTSDSGTFSIRKTDSVTEDSANNFNKLYKYRMAIAEKEIKKEFFEKNYTLKIERGELDEKAVDAEFIEKLNANMLKTLKSDAEQFGYIFEVEG